MSAIIRLARRGKKGQPFYHIVVADKRFARDARFIEKIGTYNPRTNPVSVELKFDRAVKWVQEGALPSDTMRSILSDQGVLLRAHLQKGVKKGALTQEQADSKYAQWETDRKGILEKKKTESENASKAAYEKRMAAETAIRETRTAKRKEKEAAMAAEAAKAEAEAKKSSEAAAATEMAEATDAPKAEAAADNTTVAEVSSPSEAAVAEAPKAEEVKEPAKETTEAPKAEVKQESATEVETPKAEEKAPNPANETSSEAPKPEAPAADKAEGEEK